VSERKVSLLTRPALTVRKNGPEELLFSFLTVFVERSRATEIIIFALRIVSLFSRTKKKQNQNIGLLTLPLTCGFVKNGRRRSFVRSD
jgi:hypothetical protein